MSPAPPADKKAKLEKDALSVKAGCDKHKTVEVIFTGAVKTLDHCPYNVQAKHFRLPLFFPQDDPLSLDALSALSDTLPKDEPKPESPKLRPEDFVPVREVPHCFVLMLSHVLSQLI